MKRERFYAPVKCTNLTKLQCKHEIPRFTEKRITKTTQQCCGTTSLIDRKSGVWQRDKNFSGYLGYLINIFDILSANFCDYNGNTFLTERHSVVLLQYTDLRDETVPCHNNYGEILNVVSFLYSEDSVSSLWRSIYLEV